MVISPLLFSPLPPKCIPTTTKIQTHRQCYTAFNKKRKKKERKEKKKEIFYLPGMHVTQNEE